MLLLLALGQLICLYLNLFSNCPLFLFLQSSETILGCYVTFVILKVLMNSALAWLVGTGETAKPHRLMQGIWLSHRMTEDRSPQGLPVRRDRSELELRLNLLWTMSRGWEVLCSWNQSEGSSGRSKSTSGMISVLAHSRAPGLSYLCSSVRKLQERFIQLCVLMPPSWVIWLD